MRYLESPEQDMGGGGMVGAKPKKPKAPAVPGTAGEMGQRRQAQMPQQPQTFAQMQREGLARPPMPKPSPATAPGLQPAPRGSTIITRANPDGSSPWGGGYVPSPGMEMAPPGSMVTRTADTMLPNGAGGAGGTPDFNPMDWLRQQVLGGAQGETGRAYDYLGGRIDDDYDMRQQSLRDEMASRGLADSTVYGGRTQDLNVGRRSAKADLAERLGGNQSSLQMQALGQMLGLGQQGFENDMAYNQWLMQMLGIGYGG